MIDGNQYRKVQSGQRRHLPAAVWNAMLEAIDYVQSLRDSGWTQTGGSPARGGVIPVKNTSGADVSRFQVLGIDDVLHSPSDDLDEFLSRPALTGVTPQTTAHQGKFVVTAEPVANNEVGLAIVSGITPVKIQVNEGQEDNDFAEVDDNSKAHLLLQSTGSAMILWRESGTGEKWALVRLCNPSSEPPTPETHTAHWIRFQLPSALTQYDGMALALVLEYWDGDDPDSSSQGVSVVNCALSIGTDLYMFAGDAGAVGLACFDPVAINYRIVQIQCPSS
jgi:hypothetical protein